MRLTVVHDAILVCMRALPHGLTLNHLDQLMGAKTPPAVNKRLAMIHSALDQLQTIELVDCDADMTIRANSNTRWRLTQRGADYARAARDRERIEKPKSVKE